MAFFFLKRHLIFLVLCLLVASATLYVPLQKWQQWSGHLLIFSIFLLFVVLVAGHSVNGARRWLPLGPFNLQPAEMAKLVLITYLSSYLLRRMDEVRGQISGFLKPLGLVFFLRWRRFFYWLSRILALWWCCLSRPLGCCFWRGRGSYSSSMMIMMGVAALVMLILFEPYRMRRVTSFLDPWADPLGSGYQLTQSLMAFGRRWLSLARG